ncbi:Helix-turn-helix domain-containing protein [Catalinimonas alkaloidigena]|uniref:Helix-turn-helix domain-containing protein n=1 Tax=Catalinimonas alkaloidigena TaxID=1075417 RepID=A0A1G9GVH2_9BACT|nr:helix-turn-helix domain-containing protein [Catalinimonas alkaloidigena]SDL04666.1 Helix-turn-helix domain-containing protein [Catalinimonas alkaloidigena]
MITVSHQCFAPSASLQTVVDQYWRCTASGAHHEQSSELRCMPLGTIEIIIQLQGNATSGLLDRQWQTFPRAYIVGLTKGAVVWKAYGGTELFGICLKPEGMLQLFGEPLGELTENVVDAEAFFPGDVTPIIAQIQDAPDDRTRIFLIEAFLHNQLARFHQKDNYFTEALRRIRAQETAFSATSLGKALFVSERQSQRLFKEKLGISPKAYHRLMRFRDALTRTRRNQVVSWAQLAYELGYTDQAHLIRDFKAFSGVTPAHFAERALPSR